MMPSYGCSVLSSLHKHIDFRNPNILSGGIEALAPIILEMVQWSTKYDSNTNVPDRLFKKIRNDRKGFLAEISARVKLA